MKDKHLLRKFALISTIGLLTLAGCTRRKRNFLIFFVWGSPDEVANYEEIASTFEEETGIKVKVERSSDTYFTDLVRLFSNKNQAPDIFFVESGQFSDLLSTSKLLNLSDYISSGAINIKTDDNPEGDIELWDINDNYKFDGLNYGEGDYYALIKDWTADFALWYNKDYITKYNQMFCNDDPTAPGYIEMPDEKIPMTWDEFMDISFRIQKISGTSLQHGTALNNVPYKHLFEWIQMQGGKVWGDSGYQFNYSDEKVKKGFQYFIDLQTGPKASAMNVIDASNDVGEMFHNGNIAFMFNGNWAYSTNQLDSVNFNFGICPPPVFDNSKEEKSTYAGCASMVGLGIYKSSANKQKAVQFLNHYMSYGQEYLGSKGFNIPGNKLVAESDTFRKPKDKQLAKVNEYFLNLCSNYTHPIIYNPYMGQEKVEGYIQECLKPYLSNPDPDGLDNVLFQIYSKINDDIGG